MSELTFGWIVIEAITPRGRFWYRYARCGNDLADKMVACIRRHLQNNPVFQEDGYSASVTWLPDSTEGSERVARMRRYPYTIQECTF